MVVALQLDPLITRHLPLTTIVRGFALMRSREAITIVLEVPQWS